MTRAAVQAVDDHEAVMRLALGHVAARAIHALTHFRIADHLCSGPRCAADLARVTQTDERSLLRLLRASAALGLMVEETGERFHLTGTGAALRSDAPRHACSVAATLGNARMWAAMGELVTSLQSGRPAFKAPIFGEMNPEGARLTSETMIAFYGGEPNALAQAYDFAGCRTVADIGGGSADLLTAILQVQPSLQGIVFDLPHMAPHAQRTIELRGVAERCQFTGGNFFDAVPVVADLYLLSHVINDWPEEKCLAILRNIRRTIPLHGRLLVIEQVITTDSDSNQAKFLDLISLSISGGMHRTREEHAELLAKGGFRLTRVIATQQPVSIVESQPV